MKFRLASLWSLLFFSFSFLALLALAAPSESFAKGNPCKEKKKNMRQACSGRNAKPSKCSKKTNAYNACLAKQAKGPSHGKPSRPSKPGSPGKERPGPGGKPSRY